MFSFETITYGFFSYFLSLVVPRDLHGSLPHGSVEPDQREVAVAVGEDCSGGVIKYVEFISPW